MNVTEAIRGRHSMRQFLDKPVARELIEEILDIARYAPSGGNLQPWHVYVLSGQPRDRLVADVMGRIQESPMGQETEYNVYPPDLKEPYRSRRSKCGADLYASIGVPREDRMGRMRQFVRNWCFFDAPVGLFFTLDRQMEVGQWADVGMFMQNVMLLARERGLDTCPQEAWAAWHGVVREHVGFPDEEMLFSGMSLGYADPEAPINTLRTERAGPGEFVHFRTE